MIAVHVFKDVAAKIRCETANKVKPNGTITIFRPDLLLSRFIGSATTTTTANLLFHFSLSCILILYLRDSRCGFGTYDLVLPKVNIIVKRFFVVVRNNLNAKLITELVLRYASASPVRLLHEIESN